MNIFNISLKVLNILLTLLMLSGCGVKLSKFRSDDDILGIFRTNKSEITAIMKKCKSFNNLIESKDSTREVFLHCKIYPETLKNIQTQRVYQGYKDMINSKIFNGSTILFKMEEAEELIGVDMFVEEKGFVFSETPIKDKLIEKGSLDRLIGTELFKKTRKIREEWRFKQIEPNWYIYYRQYYGGLQD